MKNKYYIVIEDENFDRMPCEAYQTIYASDISEAQDWVYKLGEDIFSTFSRAINIDYHDAIWERDLSVRMLHHELDLHENRIHLFTIYFAHSDDISEFVKYMDEDKQQYMINELKWIERQTNHAPEIIVLPNRS